MFGRREKEKDIKCKVLKKPDVGAFIKSTFLLCLFTAVCRKQ